MHFVFYKPTSSWQGCNICHVTVTSAHGAFNATGMLQTMVNCSRHEHADNLLGEQLQPQCPKCRFRCLARLAGLLMLTLRVYAG